MVKLVRVVFWMMVAAAMASCAVSGPTDPVWGKQTCGHCRMLVSDPPYAGQLLTDRKERIFFDDVGCMVEYLEEHSGAAQGLWARQDGKWIDARGARYRAGAPSPMDYGFVPDHTASLDFNGVQGAIRARKAGARR